MQYFWVTRGHKTNNQHKTLLLCTLFVCIIFLISFQKQFRSSSWFSTHVCSLATRLSIRVQSYVNQGVHHRSLGTNLQASLSSDLLWELKTTWVSENCSRSVHLWDCIGKCQFFSNILYMQCIPFFLQYIYAEHSPNWQWHKVAFSWKVKSRIFNELGCTAPMIDRWWWWGWWWWGGPEIMFSIRLIVPAGW